MANTRHKKQKKRSKTKIKARGLRRTRSAPAELQKYFSHESRRQRKHTYNKLISKIYQLESDIEDMSLQNNKHHLKRLDNNISLFKKELEKQEKELDKLLGRDKISFYP
jgi:hypothetical protein